VNKIHHRILKCPFLDYLYIFGHALEKMLFSGGNCYLGEFLGVFWVVVYIHEEFVDENHNRIKAEITAVISKSSVVRSEHRCGSHRQYFLNTKNLKISFM